MNNKNIYYSFYFLPLNSKFVNLRFGWDFLLEILLKYQIFRPDLEAAEELAALDEDLEGGALHLGAVVDAQHLN